MIMSADNSGTLALLIDGDNASPKIIVGLLEEIANYGLASVKRIYGDWTGPNLKGWKDVLPEHSIQPVQQFAYTTGKNATDGAMIHPSNQGRAVRGITLRISIDHFFTAPARSANREGRASSYSKTSAMITSALPAFPCGVSMTWG
jgi:hypothetical protein